MNAQKRVGRVGAFVRRTRVARGVTQRYVAACAGISAQYYNDFERGRREIRRPAILIAIAAAAQIDPLPILQWVRDEIAGPLDDAIEELRTR